MSIESAYAFHVALCTYGLLHWYYTALWCCRQAWDIQHGRFQLGSSKQRCLYQSWQECASWQVRILWGQAPSIQLGPLRGHQAACWECFVVELCSVWPALLCCNCSFGVACTSLLSFLDTLRVFAGWICVLDVGWNYQNLCHIHHLCATWYSVSSLSRIWHQCLLTMYILACWFNIWCLTVVSTYVIMTWVCWMLKTGAWELHYSPWVHQIANLLMHTQMRNANTMPYRVSAG